MADSPVSLETLLSTLEGAAMDRRTMTKADIIENVYEKVGGFSKKEAAEIVEAVFDTIKETLERGEKIKISGFGNFVVRDKNSRVGRNPQTGQEITISARRVLTFKPSQVLKNVLNT
jgi:integration host factor subunit alpha